MSTWLHVFNVFMVIPPKNRLTTKESTRRQPSNDSVLTNVFTHLGLLTQNFYFFGKPVRILLQSYYLVARWFGGEIPGYPLIPLPVHRILTFDRLNLLIAYKHFFQCCTKEKDEQTSTAFWIMKFTLSSRLSFPSLKVGFRAGKTFFSNIFFNVTDIESPTFTNPWKLQKWHLVRHMIALDLLLSLRSWKGLCGRLGLSMTSVSRGLVMECPTPYVVRCCLWLLLWEADVLLVWTFWIITLKIIWKILRLRPFHSALTCLE